MNCIRPEQQPVSSVTVVILEDIVDQKLRETIDVTDTITDDEKLGDRINNIIELMENSQEYKIWLILTEHSREINIIHEKFKHYYGQLYKHCMSSGLWVLNSLSVSNIRYVRFSDGQLLHDHHLLATKQYLSQQHIIVLNTKAQNKITGQYRDLSEILQTIVL